MLNRSIMGEFEEILNKVNNDGTVKAAVLISGKPDCFIAGADITYVLKIRGRNVLLTRRLEGTLY